MLDIMELKRMMEKLGQAKTHLELKKMIAEVDTTNSCSFNKKYSVKIQNESMKSTIFLLLYLKKKHPSIYIKWPCFAEVSQMNRW